LCGFAALGFLVTCGTTLAHAQFTSVVNGQQELAEPSTGALIQGDPETGHVVCTVTLIGCDSLITTAHCFNVNPELKTWVYFQHAGFYEVATHTRHPVYEEALATFPPDLFDILRVEDIAFLRLSEPVSGVTPAMLSTSQFGPGTDGEIVGFGRDPITQTSAATADQNVGIKRSGTMQLSDCEGSLAGEDVLCWEPPVPQVVTGKDVSTCDGDSGGPLFVDQFGERVVAGLTKGSVFDPQGQSDLCVPPILVYDTSVYRHLAWLTGMQPGSFPFSNKHCGELPQLDDSTESGDMLGNCVADPWDADQVRTCGFTGFLTLGQSATHSFEVPANTATMRVAFNGIASPTGSIDTNYYLRAGAPASASQYDCKADGAGNLGFCEIVAPASGIWYVGVDQDLYQGEYQVTVSLFNPIANSPPVPALGPWGLTVLMGALAAVAVIGGNRRWARPLPTRI
jgi:hypothetical protein